MKQKLQNALRWAKEIAQISVIVILIAAIAIGIMAEPTEQIDFGLGMLITKGGAALCGLLLIYLCHKWGLTTSDK